MKKQLLIALVFISASCLFGQRVGVMIDTNTGYIYPPAFKRSYQVDPKDLYGLGDLINVKARYNGYTDSPYFYEDSIKLDATYAIYIPIYSWATQAVVSTVWQCVWPGAGVGAFTNTITSFEYAENTVFDGTFGPGRFIYTSCQYTTNAMTMSPGIVTNNFVANFSPYPTINKKAQIYNAVTPTNTGVYFIRAFVTCIGPSTSTNTSTFDSFKP